MMKIMDWKLSLLLVQIFIKTGVLSLSCHSCGTLSEDPLGIEDCVESDRKLVRCQEGEYCLTFVRNYKLGSEPVRGCYPLNRTLPGLVKVLQPSPTCILEPEGAGPVKYCMCDQDNCNDVEYNVYLERARDLFTNLSMRAQDFIFPFDNSSRVSRSRVGKQTRLQCYTCGSLFNRDSPACDRFDPQNPGQLTTCNDGEACLLYTWRKSKTELGSYRECFTTSILLGHPDYPIRPAPTCKPTRTQRDERSSIRACLCTNDKCNILDEDRESPSCPSLSVGKADYADCNGEYEIVDDFVDWAPARFVYKHTSKDRYIFWNAGGLGWSIGKKDYLKSGSHWHRSGLDTKEPWEGRWEGGVTVECSESGPPVDCLWSGYNTWSTCSSTCGQGEQFRERKVLQPARAGGRQCIGDVRETRSCTSRPCPRSCEWGEYEPWSDCSKTCGGGTQQRRRQISRRADPGGAECDGKPVDVRFCNTQVCSTETESDPDTDEDLETNSINGIRFPEKSLRNATEQSFKVNISSSKDSISATEKIPITIKESIKAGEENKKSAELECIWSQWGSWSRCTRGCGVGIQKRFRLLLVGPEIQEQTCPGATQEVRICNRHSCRSDGCCSQVVVASTGNARIDQALYMGIYTRVDNKYNGRPVYRRQGRNSLFIYFFTSERDQLSLWVIGPELGQFIAGIRNSKPANCVHELVSGWKYASR
ncbi:uncharacterized protein LOC111716763 isoform X2 [Eurytemora carolleeae]|uniref:uncharacterized protein LOC111716763 isoform X2 n=1 Tax=Eurytemora carolleeae TaxID=1294199 RepID=UPI000C76A147|nr:uncharacterized protein LOC111716763 isoform X2 [Eurytemora carolleeae]|eukprot:XP_023348017.1 uncharacterized protein LOC111716763 isoform X2 [Eurytemora affinis]